MVIASQEARTAQGPSGGELDLVRVYLHELGWHPLLDRAAEVRLSQAVEEGRRAQEQLDATPAIRPRRRARLEATVAAGRRAREEFTNANLRLVVSIAKRYQHRGVDLADLVQEGNLGLMQAIDRFDWRRGYKFSTYATWWVRKAVLQAVADSTSSVRLPRHRQEQARALADASDRLERRLGHMPGAGELAREAGIRTADAVAIRRAAARVVSLSSPIEGDGNVLGDLVADPGPAIDETVVESMLPREIEHLLGALSPAAARVLRLRYGLGGGEPRTTAQVAAVLSVSPERVRQIEARALATLRHRLPPLFWAS